MMDLFQDILFTLPSFIICLREACQCYPPSSMQRAEQRISGASFADGGGSGMAGPGNNDWLMSWLGQQTGQVFFSNASGIPFAAAAAAPPGPGPGTGRSYHQMMSRTTPPFVLLPSSEQSQLTMPPNANYGNKLILVYNQLFFATIINRALISEYPSAVARWRG